MTVLLQLIIANIIGGFRFAGYKSLSFQAISHFYMGGLFMAAILATKNTLWWWAIFATLSVLELYCFFHGT
jgi:hypothetical protein